MFLGILLIQSKEFAVRVPGKIQIVSVRYILKEGECLSVSMPFHVMIWISQTCFVYNEVVCVLQAIKYTLINSLHLKQT